MESKKIIQIIAKNKFTKYVQAMEIFSFLISGYLLCSDVFYSLIMLMGGLFAAIIAGEAAIEEYKLKLGDAKSGAE